MNRDVMKHSLLNGARRPCPAAHAAADRVTATCRYVLLLGTDAGPRLQPVDVLVQNRHAALPHRIEDEVDALVARQPRRGNEIRLPGHRGDRVHLLLVGLRGDVDEIFISTWVSRLRLEVPVARRAPMQGVVAQLMEGAARTTKKSLSTRNAVPDMPTPGSRRDDTDRCRTAAGRQRAAPADNRQTRILRRRPGPTAVPPAAQ
jgi:hypothetical protein